VVVLVASAVQRAEANAEEQKRAEVRAAASEARLRLALDAAQMRTWEWDVASGAVAWAGQVEALLALPPGGFAGTLEAFRAAVHPDDLPAVDGAIARALSGDDQAYRQEFRLRADPGRWLIAQGRASRDASGRAILWKRR
jgi:PAS domain-containing protein